MNKKSLSFISSGLVIVLVFLGVTQWQQIKDYYIVQTTDLQPRSQSVGEQLALTDKADFVYQASQPSIEPADKFNQSCRDVSKEFSIVLGCYTNQKIFVFDVQDQRLDGVVQVTAAHELLHGVYDRLSQSEKEDIDAKLVAFADSVEDARFNETVAQYKKAEPGQIANELHSMLGTEIEALPKELEDYYSKYFTNRAAIVAYARQYEDSLEQYSSEIASYDTQLSALEAEKNALESSLKQQEQQIQSDSDELDRLRRTGEVQSYNQAVPSFNASIQEFNIDVNRYKQIITDYNDLVEKRNAVATTQNDLMQKLDSNYSPIEQ